MKLQQYLEERRKLIDEALDDLLPKGENQPRELHSAIRHSIFAGGKRLRPLLCLAAAEACGARGEQVLLPACAIEMIHTSSLIHDDLPCIDDDDLRRGQPTCHKVYGEATALLAGDWLMTYPFLLLSRWDGVEAERKLKTIAEIGYALGSEGMIAGQILDLRAEETTPTLGKLEELHSRKTGALIRCSLRVGAIAAGAESGILQALSHYGEKIGFAYQIVDDILDATSSLEEMGKRTGKDAAKKKLSYLSIFSLKEARARANQLCREACEALESLGSRAKPLMQLANFMVERTH